MHMMMILESSFVNLRLKCAFFESISLFLYFLFSYTLLFEFVFLKQNVDTSWNINIWLVKDRVSSLWPRVLLSFTCIRILENSREILATPCHNLTCHWLVAQLLRNHTHIAVFILNLLIKLPIDELGKMPFF